MSAPKAPPPGAASVGRLGMVSLRYDLARARNFARRLGVPPDSCDLGYLSHLVLTETFGVVSAPRPFQVRGESEGCVDLYGYVRVGADALRAHADSFAPPDAHQSVDWDAFAAKPLPASWAPLTELGFELRACPMLRPEAGGRAAGPEGEGRRPREEDVFVTAVRAAGPGARVDKGQVYGEWLSGRLGRDGAADVVRAAVVDREHVRVLRRDHKEVRSSRVVVMPAVTLRGVLRVRDGAAFDRLLGDGVGRQAGLGFGMLLLRPVRDAVAPAGAPSHSPGPRGFRVVETP